MGHDAEDTPLQRLDRINLRLPSATFDAIDAARSRRAGIVSRNTWIAEAIEEKLACEAHEANDPKVGRGDR